MAPGAPAAATPPPADTPSTLALLGELVRADEERSATLAALDELARETGAVRARADELAALLADGPVARERLALQSEEAGDEARRREEALAEAEAELAEAERSRDAGRLAAARRVQVRAKDALAMARKRVAACRDEQDRLERRLQEARAEVARLEARTSALAASLRGRPRLAVQAGRVPGPGLAGVSEWADDAGAALLVARSGLAAEREAVIREANELASAILGEPLVAASAATIARRVEQALGA